MNKQELIEIVAKQIEEPKSCAENAVNAVLCGIKKGVRKDKSVQLVGFGTFSLRLRKPRMGRNPQTGEEIKIKASKSVAFKPGKAFKDSL